MLVLDGPGQKLRHMGNKMQQAGILTASRQPCQNLGSICCPPRRQPCRIAPLLPAQNGARILKKLDLNFTDTAKSQLVAYLV